MNSVHKGVIKHPHSEEKSGKVYIGETLKNAVEAYNERNPKHVMPLIECSGKTYSYRLLASAGRELDSSELLHKFYGRYSFHEIETLMTRRRFELQQEIRRICNNLADQFPHVQATADIWAAYEAIKSTLCHRKAERKRKKRLREATAQISHPMSSEVHTKLNQNRDRNAQKAASLVEARRRKAVAGKSSLNNPFPENECQDVSERSTGAGPARHDVPTISSNLISVEVDQNASDDRHDVGGNLVREQSASVTNGRLCSKQNLSDDYSVPLRMQIRCKERMTYNHEDEDEIEPLPGRAKVKAINISSRVTPMEPFASTTMDARQPSHAVEKRKISKSNRRGMRSVQPSPIHKTAVPGIQKRKRRTPKRFQK